MRIKIDLPQFKTEKALLLVTGDQSGVLYFATKGEIEKIAEFKEEIPRYSDKEGSFMVRIKQGLGTFSSLPRSGTPYEKIEEKAQDIIANVIKLQNHLKSYEEYHSKLGNTLSTAVNQYNLSGKEFKKVDKDMLRITGDTLDLDLPVLDKPEDD